jgi:hypothetical protein
MLESDDFICETNIEWNRRKNIYEKQDKLNTKTRTHDILFHSNWEPNFHCSLAERVGNMGDGGKWVCDLSRLESMPCLVYSIGSDGEYSFEIHLKKAMPQCEIHMFDKDIHECPRKICTCHQTIVGDGLAPGTKSFHMLKAELNHTKRMIDILKMDIESGEYTFLTRMFRPSKRIINQIFPRQILVEFHSTNPENIHDTFELLRSNSYVIYSKEANVIAGPDYFEFGFLRLNSKFFKTLQYI